MVHRSFLLFSLKETTITSWITRFHIHPILACLLEERGGHLYPCVDIGRDEIGRKHAPILDREGENKGERKQV
jgi:hypothetical protein